MIKVLFNLREYNGEYIEGVYCYCGKDDCRVKKLRGSHNFSDVTIFKSMERAKKMIAHLESLYLPCNCPKFFTQIDLSQKN